MTDIILEKIRYKDKNDKLFIFYNQIAIFRSLLLPIYVLLSIFEYPHWCYINQDNNFIISCDEKIFTLNTFFINNYLYRLIEILTISLILCLNIILRSKIKVNTKTFYLRKNILYIMFGICVLDILISLIRGTYPYVNLLLRGIIYILLRYKLIIYI
jgi:hypothetical protein